MEVAPTIPILRNTVIHDVLLLKNTGAGWYTSLIIIIHMKKIEEMGGNLLLPSTNQPTKKDIL